MSDHSTFTVLLYAITVLSLVFSIGWVMILSLQEKLRAPSESFLSMNVLLLIACAIVPTNILPGANVSKAVILVSAISDLLLIGSLVAARLGKQYLFANVGGKLTSLEHIFTVGFLMLFYFAAIIMDMPVAISFSILFAVTVIFVSARIITEITKYADCSFAQKGIQATPFLILMLLMFSRLAIIASEGTLTSSIALGYSNNFVMWGFFSSVALANVSFIAHVIQTQISIITRLSMIDVLTNVPGRRAIELKLEEAQLRLDRTGESFCVIMIDIDNFKLINDSHGHAGGDAALKFASKLLSSKLRKTDMFSRWGGEEFVILLPKTELAQAGILAEKLRKTLMSTALEWKDKSILLTASFGIAQSSITANGYAEIIASADAALFKAKADGRNRVATNTTSKKIIPPKSLKDLDGIDVTYSN